jgi:hypothetical protein
MPTQNTFVAGVHETSDAAFSGVKRILADDLAADAEVGAAIAVDRDGQTGRTGTVRGCYWLSGTLVSHWASATTQS